MVVKNYSVRVRNVRDNTGTIQLSKNAYAVGNTMFPTEPIPHGWSAVELAVAADILTRDAVTSERAKIVVRAVVHSARAIPRCQGFSRCSRLRVFYCSPGIFQRREPVTGGKLAITATPFPRFQHPRVRR